jgi:hypothetical protein
MNNYWQLKKIADTLEATRIKKQADCEAAILEARPPGYRGFGSHFTNRQLT